MDKWAWMSWTRQTWVGILVGALVSLYAYGTGEKDWVAATTIGGFAGVGVWAVLDTIATKRERRRYLRELRERAAEKPRLRGV